MVGDAVKLLWFVLAVAAFLWYVGAPEKHHFVVFGTGSDNSVLLLDQETGDVMARELPSAPLKTPPSAWSY